MEEFDEEALKKTLKIDARAVGIPSGAVESFIKHTLADTKKQLKDKTTITEKDLTRTVAKELKKYNKDLAYVYENRDKIV